MFRRVKSRRLVLTAFALVIAVQPAAAMVLSCFPEREVGTARVDAYVDAFVTDAWPPKELESPRVLARFGEDIYEFFPEQVKRAEFRDGGLHIHFEQPLSAGATAEIRFEGKISAKKGEPFPMRMFIRNERRSGEGSVRCTIE